MLNIKNHYSEIISRSMNELSPLLTEYDRKKIAEDLQLQITKSMRSNKVSEEANEEAYKRFGNVISEVAAKLGRKDIVQYLLINNLFYIEKGFLN